MDYRNYIQLNHLLEWSGANVSGVNVSPPNEIVQNQDAILEKADQWVYAERAQAEPLGGGSCYSSSGNLMSSGCSGCSASSIGKNCRLGSGKYSRGAIAQPLQHREALARWLEEDHDDHPWCRWRNLGWQIQWIVAWGTQDDRERRWWWRRYCESKTVKQILQVENRKANQADRNA